MASATTYTCDCCRGRLEPDAEPGSPRYGFALRWSAADTLQLVHNWQDSRLQYCAKCIRALGDFRDTVAADKQLPN